MHFMVASNTLEDARLGGYLDRMGSVQFGAGRSREQVAEHALAGCEKPHCLDPGGDCQRGHAVTDSNHAPIGGGGGGGGASPGVATVSLVRIHSG